MIKIVVRELNGSPIGLEAKGHAKSAEKGQDLVCAAVSAILTGGANALAEECDAWEIELSEGYALFEKDPDSISDEERVILQTIITMLKTVEEEFPQYVKITEK